MDKNSITIVPPDGYIVDKENSTEEKIYFKKIPKCELPTGWYNINRIINGYIIDDKGVIQAYEGTSTDVKDKFMTIYPTYELAHAAVVLSHLLILQHIYNDGWVPDWEDRSQSKYCIYIAGNEIIRGELFRAKSILSFKTRELLDKFFNNFSELIEIAKPLIA